MPCAGLHSMLHALLDELRPPALRQTVASVFDDFIGMLDLLRSIEEALLLAEHLRDAISLFDVLHERSLSLVVQIEAEAARVGQINHELSDVLDGTCFALRHELRRVFETELLCLDVGQPRQQLRAELLRAHGLLANCLQQSVVTIAQVFDSRLTIDDLFSDIKRRREQSEVLYDQLRILLALVLRAEDEKNINTYLALQKGFKIFGTQYMHYLMYKDWAEFENFSEVISSTQSAVELRPILHRVATYLKTLIGHVSMRAVLAEGQPVANETPAIQF